MNFNIFFLLFVVATATQLHLNQTQYDEHLSRRLMYFSFITYAPDTIKCLQEHLTDKHKLSILKLKREKCRFLNDCAFYSLVSKSPPLIYIVFRGTKKWKQLLMETDNYVFYDFFNVGKVNSYFFDAHKEIWDEVSSILVNEEYKDYEVIFTGHSMGGALASISALRTVLEKKRDSDQVKLYTFGQPRVGNIHMARKHDELVPNSFRVVYRYDFVPHFPPCFEKFKKDSKVDNFPCDTNNTNGYYHHGTEIWYSKEMSDDAKYYECTGTPTNEDFNCSDGIRFHPFNLKSHVLDHNKYFEQNILSPNYAICYMSQPQTDFFDIVNTALSIDETSALFDVVINSSFVTITKTPLATITTSLDTTETTSLDTTETTAVDTTETTSLDTTETTSIDTTETTSLDTTETTSIDTTTTAPLDITASTSLDTTMISSDTTETTPLVTTTTTPFDTTTTLLKTTEMTSSDTTETTPLDITTTATLDTTASTSLDTTTTPLEATATMPSNITAMTLFNITITTPLAVIMRTSLNTTKKTSLGTTETMALDKTIAMLLEAEKVPQNSAVHLKAKIAQIVSVVVRFLRDRGL